MTSGKKNLHLFTSFLFDKLWLYQILNNKAKLDLLKKTEHLSVFIHYFALHTLSRMLVCSRPGPTEKVEIRTLPIHDATNIVASTSGQFIQATYTCDVFGPTWHLFINWFTTFQLLQTCRIVANTLTIQIIESHTDFHCFKAW